MADTFPTLERYCSQLPRKADAVTILIPDQNVWRVTKASRFAVLIDGAALFGAVREAAIKAQRSIVIMGWDIDSRTRLVGETGEAQDGYPIELAAFLSALVERRPVAPAAVGLLSPLRY